MFQLKRLDRYILGAVITPLVAVLALAVALLVLEQMLRLFDFVLAENGEVGVVWRLLAWLVPEYVSLALPIGFMLGVMFAVRRFSLSSELRAMLGTGASIGRLMRPVFMFAGFLLAINFLVVGYIQPFSAYQYSRLTFEVQSRALTAQVRPGVFVPVNDYTTLRIEGRSADKEWRQVFLEVCEDAESNVCQVITASRGALVDEPSPRGELLLRLFDGTQVETGQTGPRVNVLSFRQWDVPIEVGVPAAFRSRGLDRKEITFTELVRSLFVDGVADEAERHSREASLHWRILHILLMLMIPLAAAPLAITDPRKDSALGVLLGVGGIIVYFKLMQSAEAEVARGLANPFLVMWPIAAVFAVLGLGLFAWTMVRPGLRPLAALEVPFEAAAEAIRRLVGGISALGFRKKRREEAEGSTYRAIIGGGAGFAEFLRPTALPLYLARLFFVRLVIVLAIMTGVLQILDLLSAADDIMAAPGAGPGSIWLYVGLKFPGFISTFAPFAVLLAALATLAELSHRNEINAIRSSGVSAFQLLAPLCLVGALTGLGHFVFQEAIAAPAAGRLGLWKDADYSPAALSNREAFRRDVWVADGPVIVKARSAIRAADDSIDFSGVTILERSEAGLSERLATVGRAQLRDGVLAAQSVSQLSFATSDRIELRRAWWQVLQPPERIIGRALVVEEAKLSEIREHLRTGETIGERTPVLATALFHRFSGPMASALMPLLAAIAGFGLARRGGFIGRLLIGAGLGFAYFVAQNAMVAMGNLGAIPPPAAAFAPIVAFLMIGAGAVLFLED